MHLTDRETAHVLACLRYCQGKKLEHMEHFDSVAPLSDEETDDLCERLNMAGPPGGHYTVLCLMPDSYWDGSMRDATRVEWVEAENPSLAAEKARRQSAAEYVVLAPPGDKAAAEAETKEIAPNIEVLSIFPGHLRDLYDPRGEGPDQELQEQA